MFHWLATFLFVVSFALFGFAQNQEQKIACYAFPKTTESYKKKLWDGYESRSGPRGTRPKPMVAIARLPSTTRRGKSYFARPGSE
jgi:hypothetical protein